jgi:hypothetical protein
MNSILDYKGDKFEKLMAWARYLHWADVHRRHFEVWMEQDHDVANDREGWEFIALLSAWYASLWVVVEGWKSIPLADSSVDELLQIAPRYEALLKRYRNGVFHYQPRLIEKRLLDFLAEEGGSASWIDLLLSEIRNSVYGIVGWIPADIPLAQISDLRKEVATSISMLQNADDFTSPSARNILDAAAQCDAIASETEEKFRVRKQEMLKHIKSRRCL